MRIKNVQRMERTYSSLQRIISFTETQILTDLYKASRIKYLNYKATLRKDIYKKNKRLILPVILFYLLNLHVQNVIKMIKNFQKNINHNF